MTNNIINSLKRLERAGEENSRHTKKLKEATANVASQIFDSVKDSIELDTNYAIEWDYEKIADGLYFCKIGNNNPFISLCADSPEEADQNCINEYEFVTRVNAFEFAKMVNEGVIDKVAEYLEQKRERAIKATERLEFAKI